LLVFLLQVNIQNLDRKLVSDCEEKPQTGLNSMYLSLLYVITLSICIVPSLVIVDAHVAGKDGSYFYVEN